MAKQVIKVGDLVRVPRRNTWQHHYIGFGVVATVVEVDALDSTVYVQGMCQNGRERLFDGLPQWVPVAGLKLAKQAMKQRDAYRERR